MLKQSISVKDHTQSSSNVKHITVDGEDIRPSFEMFFQSTLSGKIFKII